MKRRLLAALLAALCLCSACGKPKEFATAPTAERSPSGESASAESVSPQPEPEDAPSAIDLLLASMTLEEKVGQLFFVRVPETDALTDIESYHIGGYLLFGRDFKDKTANEIIQTIAAYQSASPIPLLIGADEEGGTVVRISSNPHLRSEPFRSPQKLFSAGGMEKIVSDTHEKDILLSALGVNVNLAPVCDVSDNPKDFIYPRTLGQDADQTAAYVAAVTARMSADGMGSVLKHFPGYGNNTDTHTGVAVDHRSIETFEASDFLPFSAGFDAGQGKTAVLMSHNIVTCLDAGLPASLSPAAYQILRKKLGFDGVAMTDDLAMDAVEAYAKDGAVAVMALTAGSDMVVTTDYRTQIPAVISAVERGELEAHIIDDACIRVLRWKEALGLLEPCP